MICPFGQSPNPKVIMSRKEKKLDAYVSQVLEVIFNRGLVIPNFYDVRRYVKGQKLTGLNAEKVATNCEFRYRLGNFDCDHNSYISTSDSAANLKLAVHEAGHAMIGLQTGLVLTGVRFFSHTSPPSGSTLLHTPESYIDADRSIRISIRNDLAGNVAQMMVPGCEPTEGYLSTCCGVDVPVVDNCSDLCHAYDQAKRLLQNSNSSLPQSAQIRQIFEAEESEIRAFFERRIFVLKRLANEFMKRPMTGTQIRRLIAR